MVKEEIRLKKVIVHILDSLVGMPVLSETEFEFGSDFADFIKDHISKSVSGDDCKHCEFQKDFSEIYEMLTTYKEEDFVSFSQKTANSLYDIMNSNVDIPAADLILARFRYDETEYMAILKMNYKEYYTHRTMPSDDGNLNEIIRFKSILPSEGQKLQEAAVISLQDFSIRLIEKKAEVNGEKLDYFSELFLKCRTHLSNKAKLNIVTKAVESVQRDHFQESKQYEEHMKAKSIIQDTLDEKGSFFVEEISEKIFPEDIELQTAFQDHMEKYNLVKEEISPVNEATVKKFQKQHIQTDTGIELKIPMDQYRDPGKVEFITNEDGTISVLIKNINHITAKF